jgi:uncharacterized protein (DUF1330 family)
VQANHKLAIALFVGAAVGGLAVQGLHAQAKPPAYVIAEIDVMDQDGYAKEYQPAAVKVIRGAGGKFLSRGGNAVSFRGEPPKRIVLFAFENMDQAQAAFTSAAYNDAWTIGSKYAKFRIFAVEGISQ